MRLAVPAESFLRVLVFAFGADADGTVGAFYDDGVQEFFFGEIVVEAFALFTACLGVQLIFKHRIRIGAVAVSASRRSSTSSVLRFIVAVRVSALEI